MEKYPGRVCSKPVFTACPPAIFSGADFALIPSRDEPFGLVAVEFGRKGALGIGCMMHRYYPCIFTDILQVRLVVWETCRVGGRLLTIAGFMPLIFPGTQ